MGLAPSLNRRVDTLDAQRVEHVGHHDTQEDVWLTRPRNGAVFSVMGVSMAVQTLIAAAEFQIARALDGSTTIGGTRVGTSPGVVLGTVGYMAPERVRAQVVDHRVDIFTLGCVRYELVTGQRAVAWLLTPTRRTISARSSRRLLGRRPGSDHAWILPAIVSGRELAIERLATELQAHLRAPFEVDGPLEALELERRPAPVDSGRGRRRRLRQRSRRLAFH